MASKSPIFRENGYKDYSNLDSIARHGKTLSLTGLLGISGAVGAVVSGCATQSRGGEEAPERLGSDTVYVQVQPDTAVAPPEPDTLPPEPDTVQVQEPEVSYVSPDTVAPDTISPDTALPEEDDDKDGIPNSKDKCMQTPDYPDQNGESMDIDGDGKGDACDNAPAKANPGQEDADGDGVGDVIDNAPNNYNPSQADNDKDGVGNIIDICPDDFDPEQKDDDGDKFGAACGDCNDNSADVNPGALDAPCDSEDTDCGGEAEDADSGCACVVDDTKGIPGSCADGEQTCQLTGAETSGWVTTTEPNNGYPEQCADDADNDCDGMTDNAPDCVDECDPGTVVNCGETAGECGKQLGTSTCDLKGAWGECVGAGQPKAEECNGADDDCDEDTDEDFGVGEPCTAKGACGKVEGHKECFGTNATICDNAPGGSKSASVSEICDGEDNDCDGGVDNVAFSVVGGAKDETALVGTACKGVGECGSGTYKCEDTLAVKCSAFDKAAPIDACDAAGKDENCDGVSNPGCECDDGDADKSCQTQPNVCAKGTQTCENGKWSDCKGEVPGTPETCNGVDDNCDGTVDNLPAGTKGADCEGKMGVCADTSGKFECDDNGGVVCTSEYSATQEVCGNKLDDDCDGKKDEGPFTVKGGKPGELANPGEACSTGVGECEGPGVFVCASDSAVECDNGKTPGVELPDSEQKDEDCDGASNEKFDCKDGDPAKSCQSQPVVCETGEQTCVGGQLSDCVGEKLGTAEVCDGADNDCNGTADDVFNIGGACDGKGDVCGAGVLQCDPNDPNKTMCSTMPGGKDDQSGTEVCDGLDNNCNGTVDDLTDGTVGKACPGEGVCPSGVLECDKGVLECSTMEGGSQYIGKAEVCDGLDNNCDGKTDEGVWPGAGAVGMPCSGTGACEGSGYNVCATDQATKCSLDDNATAEKADGVDNDCDKSVDEGFECKQGDKNPCGTNEGECTVGEQICVGGKLTDCNDVGGSPEKCDGLDNDCDSLTDEGFDGVGGLEECNGKGVCNIGGNPECTSDGTGTKCNVAPGGSKDQSSDEICDGKDNDCDGKTDEGIGTLGLPGDSCFNPGVCGKGTVHCDGLSATECHTSIMPDQLSEKCNGKDDDCDKAVDEGYEVGATCTNNCGDTGIKQCSVDGLVAECSAKIKSEVPADGVDNDCDGQVDEQP